MKYITIFGSIGVNIGDDLMNRVICLACHRLNHIPQVASMRPSETNRIYNETTFSSSVKSIYSWFPAIRRSTLVIIGGGTLIQNDFRGPTSRILLYTVSAILISHFIFRKRVVAVGLGINKVNKINTFLAKAYAYCDSIYVRDEQSLVNSKLVSLRNVRIFPDIGLGLQFDQAIGDSHVSSTVKSRYICISLVREDLEEFSIAAGRALLNAAQKNGLFVYAICMDKRDSEEKYIYCRLQEEFADSLEITEPNSPYDLVALLSNSALNIGMRLHFSVMSLLCGRNPVVISRETKTEWIREAFPNSKRIDAFSNDLVDKLEFAVTQALVIPNGFDSKDVERLENCRRAVNDLLDSTILNA